MAAGARVPEVARRHGICTSLIYCWRWDASPTVGSGTAVRLLPVRVVEPRAPTKSRAGTPPTSTSETRRGGLIEIELDGGVRVRVDSDVSLAALRRVVTALRG